MPACEKKPTEALSIGFYDSQTNIFYKVAETDELGFQDVMTVLQKLYPQLPLTSHNIGNNPKK